ncbi:MAG: Kelch repeat-containing protein [Polyangiaceae bacterium]
MIPTCTESSHGRSGDYNGVMARSMVLVGGAFVALVAGCGARTGLQAWSDTGVAAEAGAAGDAGLAADAALDDGQSCADAGCIAQRPTGVVLLGRTGLSAPDFLPSTWAWDGTSWTEQDVVSPQPARDNASMSRLNDSSVLFGGRAAPPANGLLADTWVWSGGWAQQSASGPSPRERAAMATLGYTVVLFGGRDAHGVEGDTWTWNGASWTRIDTPGPSARCAHAMATLRGTVVLFGGKNGDVQSPGGPLFGDTWTWNGKSWTQLDVAGPGARVSPAMATLGDTVVLLGGMDESGSVLGDTWTWDGAAWTPVDVQGPTTVKGVPAIPNLVATLEGTVVLYSAPQSLGPSYTWTWKGTSWKRLDVIGPNLLEGPFQAAVMSTW